MQSSMVKVLCILLRYFQDTISNSIEPCTLCHMAPRYDIKVQAQIPAALCALHNFIQMHSYDASEESHQSDDDNDDLNGDAPGPEASDIPLVSDIPDDDDAKAWQDEIAEMMWMAYQQILEHRGERIAVDGEESEQGERSSDDEESDEDRSR